MILSFRTIITRQSQEIPFRVAQQAAPNLHSLFLAATFTAGVGIRITFASTQPFASFASFIIRDIHVPFRSGLDLLHFSLLSYTAYTQY